MAFLVKALSRWYVQRLGDRLGAMGAYCSKGVWAAAFLFSLYFWGLTLLPLLAPPTLLTHLTLHPTPCTGLTYHDAMAETGVYEQAVERLPADLQEQRSVSAAAPTLTWQSSWGHYALLQHTSWFN